ncbi:hypothetical protein ACIPSQ_16755 [Pectobacterium parvum]|uniref:hypothetical protein n=1 Tax=Pectobacterium TaxID=122277 RepID=UPI0013FD1536|nr:hypothetical protein [Pectobacterium polaris]
MSQKENRADPYVTATKYGYIEGDNGLAFIGFGFDTPVTITNSDRFFVGLALDEVEELAAILQDHVNRNRHK